MKTARAFTQYIFYVLIDICFLAIGFRVALIAAKAKVILPASIDFDTKFHLVKLVSREFLLNGWWYGSASFWIYAVSIPVIVCVWGTIRILFYYSSMQVIQFGLHPMCVLSLSNKTFSQLHIRSSASATALAVIVSLFLENQHPDVVPVMVPSIRFIILWTILYFSLEFVRLYLGVLKSIRNRSVATKYCTCGYPGENGKICSECGVLLGPNQIFRWSIRIVIYRIFRLGASSHDEHFTM
jgi:hypothetical protein